MWLSIVTWYGNWHLLTAPSLLLWSKWIYIFFISNKSNCQYDVGSLFWFPYYSMMIDPQSVIHPSFPIPPPIAQFMTCWLPSSDYCFRCCCWSRFPPYTVISHHLKLTMTYLLAMKRWQWSQDLAVATEYFFSLCRRDWSIKIQRPATNPVRVCA